MSLPLPPAEAENGQSSGGLGGRDRRKPVVIDKVNQVSVRSGRNKYGGLSFCRFDVFEIMICKKKTTFGVFFDGRIFDTRQLYRIF